MRYFFDKKRAFAIIINVSNNKSVNCGGLTLKMCYFFNERRKTKISKALEICQRHPLLKCVFNQF